MNVPPDKILDRAPRSALFALGRGRNVHFRAVLGDGAAADLDAESRERQTKRLVRERRGRVLCANEALQPLLASKKRQVKADSEYELNGKLIRFALGRGFGMDIIRRCIGGADEYDV